MSFIHHEAEPRMTNTQAANKLQLCGIRRRWTAYFVTGPLLYLLIALISLVIAVSMSIFKFPNEIVVLFVTVGLPLIGIQEWRSSKTEAALDKFYDRLTLTNERLRIWKNPRIFISKAWSQKKTFEVEMYVCLEVDNLEYVIQKYERGYMEPKDALREFTCFSSRCHGGRFKEIALSVAARGGYKNDTMTALTRICCVCPQEMCPQRAAIEDFLWKV